MRCQRHVGTLCGAEGLSLRYDVIWHAMNMLHLWCSLDWGDVGLGLEPEGLDFAADSDDVAGGDGAHDEHSHHD